MLDRVEELRFLLQELTADNEYIQGTLIVSVQGLPICSLFNDRTINESLVSAISAAILAVGERAAEELKRGNLNRTLIEGDDGFMILTQAGEHALLVTLASKQARLGIIFMQIGSVVKKIINVLESK